MLHEKPMACLMVPASRLAAGTQALIQLLPYLAVPGPVAIVGPTYSEHTAAWRNAGHPVIAIDHLDGLPGKRGPRGRRQSQQSRWLHRRSARR